MRKICVLLVVLILFTTCVYAATNATATLTLDFDGTKATCTAVANDLGSNITITMYLYKGSTLVRSWSKSGTNKVTLQKECTCISGQVYTLDADITANGSPVNVLPVTKTCP